MLVFKQLLTFFKVWCSIATKVIYFLTTWSRKGTLCVKWTESQVTKYQQTEIPMTESSIYGFSPFLLLVQFNQLYSGIGIIASCDTVTGDSVHYHKEFLFMIVRIVSSCSLSSEEVHSRVLGQTITLGNIGSDISIKSLKRKT